MPLDKSSDETLIDDIRKYIQYSDIFFSTHPTTANKWCLGIKAENSKIAEELRGYLCHIHPFSNQINNKLSNIPAGKWCNGNYNVVVVTQYSEEELKAIQRQFASSATEDNE